MFYYLHIYTRIEHIKKLLTSFLVPLLLDDSGLSNGSFLATFFLFDFFPIHDKKLILHVYKLIFKD